MSNKQTILVTGSSGQLGTACLNELNKREFENVFGISKKTVDISEKKAIQEYIISLKPSVVIHTAAWTAVDDAEQKQDEVYKVNSFATKYIAETCNEINATLVYISTDYVFDGNKLKPYEISDEKNGLSIYGKSKSIGEDYVEAIMKNYFIVRTSGVFGKAGKNFIKTMYNIGLSGQAEVNVVNDQICSITYANDLAAFICDLFKTNKYGIYHATNEGYISWAQVARDIFKFSGFNTKVNKITSDEYKRNHPMQATRPQNSRLSKNSLTSNGFSRLPNYMDAIIRYLKEIK